MPCRRASRELASWSRGRLVMPAPGRPLTGTETNLQTILKLGETVVVTPADELLGGEADRGVGEITS